MSELLTETKHPDFLGLQLLDDPIGSGAQIAQNCDLHKVAQLDKRPGYRRVNQIRYQGGIAAIIDVQRICDYQKMLIVGGLFGPVDIGAPVFEHEASAAVGGSGAEPFFDPNLPPIAVADAVPDSGFAPLNVSFSSLGSYDPEGDELTYSWDFGDGTPPSTDPNPNHQYNTPGIFTASLTVTDPEGAQGVDTVEVNMAETLLVAKTASAAVSQDGGLTFAAPAGVGQANFALAKEDGGLLFIFDQDGAGNRVDVYRSDDRGLSFVLVSNIPSQAGAASQPILANNGRIIVPIIQVGTTFYAVAYSDDNGDTWTVSVVLAVAEIGGTGAPTLTYVGGAQVAAFVRLGGGVPIDTHISNDNAGAWGAGVAGFALSNGFPRVGTLLGGRLVVAGITAGGWEIRTSDDLAVSWQLRSGPHAFAFISMGASGAEAIAGPAALGTRFSVNTGIAWADGPQFGFGAFKRSFIRTSQGWFCGSQTDVYFAPALAAFVLRGNTGVGGQIQSMAFLPPS